MLGGAPAHVFLSEFVMIRVLRQSGSNLVNASTRGVHIPASPTVASDSCASPLFRLFDGSEDDFLRVYAIVI